MKVMMYLPSGTRGLREVGGAEFFTRRLMTELAVKDVGTNLLVFGYRCTVTGWAKDYPVYFITPHTETYWHKPRSWASLARSILQIHLAMRRSGSRVLHAQGAWGEIMVSGTIAKLLGRWKIVVTLHSMLEVGRPRLQNPLLYRRVDRLLRHADAVVGVSHAVASRANQSFPSLRKRVEVIYNGIEAFWFEPPEHIPSKTYLLFVGRLDLVKGLDDLLSAWKLLGESKRSRAELWLVGDGPARSSLEARIASERMTESVRLWGALQDAEQLRALYAGACALVLPSRSEGLPYVLLEAGACGTICIGADVGGIPEVIIPNETGFLFPPGDVEQLAEYMRHVLEMPEADRRRMSERARQRIREHFSLDRTVERYLEVYRRVLGGADAC